MADSDIDAADGRLRRWFAGRERVAVAFSGGVDSALVAWYARRALGRERMEAWIGDSPSLTRRDLGEARSFAAAHDIPVRVIPTSELEDPVYAANPLDRCYHCKRRLYATILAELAMQAVGFCLCSGANRDDLGDHRPGMRAAAEAGVHHPLIDCAIDKALVRALAHRQGLAVADKPAAPCLSSRIPYGQAVDRAKLAQIEAGEGWLHEQGFPICRLRHHGDTAVIEVPPDRLADLQQLADDLAGALRPLGFAVVRIDAEGFVSGKLNRGLV